MTRPVHSFAHHVTLCGRLPSRVVTTSRPWAVTCKRCLKLIGAQQPSGAATARASAVEPVERRATVAATDSRPKCSFCGNHEGDGCCDKLCHGVGGLEICNVCVANCARICGLLGSGAGAFGISLTAQSMPNERADMVRDLREKYARLESLLREVVEADDEYRGSLNAEAKSEPDSDEYDAAFASGRVALVRLESAIEAARGGIGGKNG